MKLLRSLFILVSASLLFSSCGYNGMVEKREAVDQSWAQVQNVYQRRADLIPNLVNTVKGAANFEKETLTEVINARAKATSIQLNANDLTPEKLQQFEAAQSQLSGALSRLMVTVEKYPDLKANANFQTLQGQLEGTENRITVERMKFNTSVQDYNTFIKRFPNNLTSGMFGFDKKAYFQADPASQKAPTVTF